MAPKKSTVGKKPMATRSRRPQATEEAKELPGRVRLGLAAGRALKSNSEKIAQSLADRSIKGNLQSARFLLELAEASEQLAKEKDKRPGPSQAMSLAEEPEWGSEEPEQVAKSTRAQRKKTEA